MKAKFALVLLLASAFVGWWLSGTLSSSSERASSSITRPPAVSAAQVLQPYAKTPYRGLDDPRWAERRRLEEVIPDYQWRTPIEFFGKVVDENERPVEGAVVEVTWIGTPEASGGDGVGRKVLSTDPDGLFNLRGVQGKAITVRVSKSGYHVPSQSNMRRFEYAGFWEPTYIEPDRGKPIIFPLVKRPVAEPTYRIGSRVFLPPPALETHLDLLGPELQSMGPADLHVQVFRPKNAGYERPFDWSVSIEGRNGAEIVETDDEFLLQAPAQGYQPKLVREFKNPTGNARQNVRFYVRSKGRKFYAGVKFEMAAYRRIGGSEPASIVISATVNPNDSPNVEYDPKKGHP